MTDSRTIIPALFLWKKHERDVKNITVACENIFLKTDNSQGTKHLKYSGH